MARLQSLGDAPIRYLGKRSRAVAAGVWRASDVSPSVLALSPLTALYGGVVRARRHAYAQGVLQSVHVSVPVISVGNIAVGGSGKTPVTRWVVEQLLERGQRPAVLHGGYAADEPALHRSWYQQVPVFEGKNRVASAERAIKDGATVLVLDDGLQHLRLARALDIVLIAADSWDTPRRMLPAGAWREPLATLRDVEIIAITRKAASRAAAERVASEIRKQTGDHSPCIIALKLDGLMHRGLDTAPPGGPVVALSSIADPQAFARQLTELGLQVSEVFAFGDHHDYEREDLQTVRTLARERAIVTTEKDAVKLSALDPAFEVRVARQSVIVEAGLAELEAAIDAALLAG
jgi:tetraacyldisaccharide 4'-kinase